MRVGPFWRYFGGKHRAAPLYQKPRHDLIVEPFAGAAGYACHYADRDVLLIDADPNVIDTWRLLIGASASDVLALPPRLEKGARPDEMGLGEMTLLLRWWCNPGAATPNRAASSRAVWWGWNRSVRARIAAGVDRISHWRAEVGDYRSAPDVSATWFVDPPYVRAGRHYRRSSVDYRALSAWCMGRRGQTIVCEAAGAEWMPFRRLGRVKAAGYKGVSSHSQEVVWTSDPDRQLSLFAEVAP